MPARYVFTGKTVEGRFEEIAVIAGSYAEAEPEAQREAAKRALVFIGFGPAARYRPPAPKPSAPATYRSSPHRTYPQAPAHVHPFRPTAGARDFHDFVTLDPVALAQEAEDMAEAFSKRQANLSEVNALLRVLAHHMARQS